MEIVEKNAKGALLEDSEFPEIYPQTVFRDRQFDPQRRRQMEKAKTRKCGEFYGSESGLKIRLKRSSDAIWRPVLLKDNI